MEPVFLYIMYDKNRNYCKIGRSNDPLKRSLMIPQEIDYKRSVCVMGPESLIKPAEKGVHRTFYQKNLVHSVYFDGHTEWFCNSSIKLIKKYLSTYFDLSDWVSFGDNNCLAESVNVYKVNNKSLIRTEYGYVIEFNNDEEDLSLNTILYGPSNVNKSAFHYSSFKSLWIWFFLRKTNIFVINYNSDGRNLSITLHREDIKNIYGYREEVAY